MSSSDHKTNSPKESSYLLKETNYNVLCEILSWIYFRELCVVVRKVNSALDQIVTKSDEFWALMCDIHGIHGTIVEKLGPNEPLEPSPFDILDGPLLSHPKFSMYGSNFLDWQLVVSLYMHRNFCLHINKQVIEEALPVLAKEMQKVEMISIDLAGVQGESLTRASPTQMMARRAHVIDETSRQGSVELPARGLPCMCASCGQPAQFVCATCGKPLCSGSASGCMRKHAERFQSERKKKEGSSGVGESHHLGIRREYIAVYCYECNTEFQPGSKPRTGSLSSLTQDPSNTAVPRSVIKYFSTRNVFSALDHFGLFQRNECPHLDEKFIFEFVAKKWKSCCQGVANSHCQYESSPPTGGAKVKCSSMKVFACLHCFYVACGAQYQGHMWRHCQQSQHFLIVQIRNLDLYCLSCDRYLGYGGSERDRVLSGKLREVLRVPHLFCQHRHCLWDYDVSDEVVETLLLAAVTEVEKKQ